MYILLDLDRMRVLHKYREPVPLCDIAWIECQSSSYAIFPSDSVSEVRSLTRTEMELLFRNCTGEAPPTVENKRLIQYILDLFDRIAESDIVPAEVSIQAENVKEGDTRTLRYVRKAKRPAVVTTLFEGQTVSRSMDNEKKIDSGELVHAPKADQALPVSPATVKAPAAENRPSAPKRGTAKAIIWQVADDMWEQAGKPIQKEQVLALRKQIMEKLELSEGIKKLSSSSELGQWHKIRAPF